MLRHLDLLISAHLAPHRRHWSGFTHPCKRLQTVTRRVSVNVPFCDPLQSSGYLWVWTEWPSPRWRAAGCCPRPPSSGRCARRNHRTAATRTRSCTRSFHTEPEQDNKDDFRTELCVKELSWDPNGPYAPPEGSMWSAAGEPEGWIALANTGQCRRPGSFLQSLSSKPQSGTWWSPESGNLPPRPQTPFCTLWWCDLQWRRRTCRTWDWSSTVVGSDLDQHVLTSLSIEAGKVGGCLLVIGGQAFVVLGSLAILLPSLSPSGSAPDNDGHINIVMKTGQVRTRVDCDQTPLMQALN